MFDFNWPELLIIATVALIVIGPEDLPLMFRQLGRFTSKLRQMSRDFSRAMDQAAKDSGVKDVVKDLKASTSSSALGLDAVKSAADRFEKWDPMKNAAKPSMPMPARTLVPPPMPATPATVVTPAASSAAPQAKLVDDAAEAAEDLAEHGPEAAQVPAPVHGLATQALYDKQALRAQVLKEQTEKLKAIEAGTYAAPPTPDTVDVQAVIPPAVKPAPKRRTSKPAATTPDEAETLAKAPAKPRRAAPKPKGEETA